MLIPALHKRWLFFLILIWLCLPAYSQQKFKGGIGAGLIASQIGGDGFAGFDKFGFQAGGFVNTDLKKEVLDIQFELMYVEKGSRNPPRPNRIPPRYQDYKIDIAYMDIPLILKYHLNQFWFEAGLSYGRLIRHRVFNEQGRIIETDQDFFPMKNWEIAGILGVNYQITEQISSNARIIQSLYPVSGKTFVHRQWGFVGGSYNTAISLSLRYQFITNANGNDG